MHTQLIFRTLPVSYSYQVMQHLDLQECPICQAEHPQVEDGKVVCGLCGHVFKFTKSQKSQREYACALYYAASRLDHEDLFEQALPLYEQAEKLFLQFLKKKEDADLIYCLAQIHYARGRAILPESTEKAMEEFDEFLKLMNQFARLREQDGPACFITARTYYNVGDQLDGIVPAAEYFQKSLDWLEKAKGDKQDSFDDFIFNMRQDSLMRLARAFNNPQEPLHDEKKAKELFLELADILEECRLEPQHMNPFSFYPREVFDPSCFVKLAEGAGEYAKALKENGESGRIDYMFERAMDLSRRVFRCFNNIPSAEAMLQVYQDAFDFYRSEKDYEKAKQAMQKRADLWKGSLLKELDFYSQHELLEKRLETNRLLADLYHENKETELEEKAYKSNINLLNRAKKNYESQAPWLETARAFLHLQARFDLAKHYLKENKPEQAIKTFQTFLNDYQSFIDSEPDSFYLEQNPLFPERQLVRQMIELLEKLDSKILQKKSTVSLLEQARSIQARLDEIEIPVIDPLDDPGFLDWLEKL